MEARVSSFKAVKSREAAQQKTPFLDKSIFIFIQAWLNKEKFEFTVSQENYLLDHWKEIEAHGLCGLVSNLIMSCESSVDPELKKRAENRYLSNTLHNEKAKKICADINLAARENIISLSIMKGPALEHQAYYDSGIRGYGDIDLCLPSKEESQRLLDALKVNQIDFKGERSFVGRFQDPGKISASYQGTVLEFMYPLKFPSDGMLETLEYFQPYGIYESTDDLLNPDPTLHMLFLLMHMTTNHFCCRLIWFLDLVVFYREQRHRIDLQKLNHKLAKIEMENGCYFIGEFCRKYLDPQFPQIGNKLPGWNQKFTEYMLDVNTVLSREMEIDYSSVKNVGRMVLFRIGTFYILGDAKPFYKEFTSQATRRSCRRFAHGFQLDFSPLIKVFEFLCPFVVGVMARAAIFLGFSKKRPIMD